MTFKLFSRANVRRCEGANARQCEGASTRVRIVTVMAALPIAGMLVARPAEAATYGGSATGAVVTVPATGTTIRAATGAISISGGGAEAALLVGDIPGSATGGVVSLAAGVMHAAIVGLDATRAEASMANITLTVSNNTITADFIMARGTTSCGPAVAGDSTLPNLVINGQAITVTGVPNQVVSLPNGTATINEQTSSIGATSAAITVNALHVVTTDPITQAQLADVVLAQAAPQIDCSSGTPPNANFTTGGGYVTGDTGGRTNFGAVGGIQQNGSFMGHLVVDDHSVNFTFQSTSVDAVDPSTPCQTTYSGSGNYSSSAGSGTATYSVTIHDVATPGSAGDTFSVQIPAGTGAIYTNGVNIQLLGGNITAHSSLCPH